MKFITLILTFISLQVFAAKDVGVRIERISCDYVSSGSGPKISIEISPGYKFKGRKIYDFIKRPNSEFCLDLSEFEGQIVSRARFKEYSKRENEYDKSDKCYEVEYTYLQIIIKSSFSTREIDAYTLLEKRKIMPLRSDYCVDNPY